MDYHKGDEEHWQDLAEQIAVDMGQPVDSDTVALQMADWSKTAAVANRGIYVRVLADPFLSN